MTKDPAAPGFKEKAKRDFKDFIIISAYLAIFFCALTTYTMLLLRKYDVNYLDYSFAIINALIIAKVILIGQMAHIGTGAESRPLYQSVVYKAFVFGLLCLAFHFFEEFIKRLIHHKPFGAVWNDLHFDDLMGKSLIVFCTFIPLFAFIELRRVMGEKEFYSLFLTPGAEAKPTPAKN
jgi:hypothetical protein